MGARTALHGFFVGMQAPLPNSRGARSDRASPSHLVFAVVVGKMLAAQAHKQNELS